MQSSGWRGAQVLFRAPSHFWKPSLLIQSPNLTITVLLCDVPVSDIMASDKSKGGQLVTSGWGPEEKASVLYYLVFNIWYKKIKDVETYPLNITGEVKKLKIYDLFRLLTMF